MDALPWRHKPMTLTLTPDAEARLRSVAAQRGLPPEQTIDVLLAEADTDFQQAVAGIQRGIDDFAAGHWISLEDYEAQIQSEQPSGSVGKDGA
jgi:predicted transcriptional regulator